MEFIGHLWEGFGFWGYLFFEVLANLTSRLSQLDKFVCTGFGPNVPANLHDDGSSVIV
jgi:hypothetical protein